MLSYQRNLILYDAAHRLTSLTNPDNQTTTFLYDALDRLTQQTHHNGTYATYAFNAAGDLTQLEHRTSSSGLLSAFGYAYNNVGNLTRTSETVSGYSATTTYLYDTLDRLTQEKRTTSNTYWYEYLYDAAGNRTKFIQKDQDGNQTGSKGYAYDAANKLTLEGDLSNPSANGNIQYTFDSNGNLTKKQIVGDGNTTYLYDFENHLTKLSDGVTLTFTYDGDGVRKSLTNGSLTTRFIHDFDGLTILAETDGSGSTTATYTYGLGLISQKRGSTTSYYHADRIGTTRQMTNSSQTVTDSYVHDAWGNLLASTGSTANPYRYAGQWGYYDDGQSGLMLLGWRYYDAGVGRFITQDPIRDGLNWYGYVRGNPIHEVDPLGLESTFVFVFGPSPDININIFDVVLAMMGLKEVAPFDPFSWYYAQQGYNKFAEIVRRGHGCAACHLTHFHPWNKPLIPTDDEIDLDHYNRGCITQNLQLVGAVPPCQPLLRT